MSLLAILTLVVVGVIVATLAVTLAMILVQLRRIRSTLGKVNVGLRGIAQRVQPLEPILAEVNGDLAAVRDRLVGVLQRRKDRV
jgi:hypothetical protein